MILRTSLRYFDQVARDQSIRKAAEKLHVAASAVDRQLLKLEEELGVPLFERLPRGVRPTAAGEILLSYIRRWNAEATTLRHQLESLRGGERGTIEIAAAEAAADVILPAAIADLRRRFPHIEFNITTGDSSQILQALLAHEADVGIAFNIKPSRGVRSIMDLQLPLGIVVAPDHPLAQLRHATLDDCAPYPVLIPSDSWIEQSAVKRLVSDSRHRLDIVARGVRVGVLKALARARAGIAFLTALEVDHEVRARQLVYIPLAHRNLDVPSLSVLTPASRSVPVYTAMFLERVKEQLAAYVLPQHTG
jgi:DNA-binding transcriptional LysR family regulator